MISASDNGILYDFEKYKSLTSNPEIDVIIFTFRRHVSSKNKPEMYGWVDVDKDDYAKKVSVKKAISGDPFNDHAVVGTFWFRKIK